MKAIAKYIVTGLQVIILLTIMVFVSVGSEAQAAMIKGTLYNFDLKNWTDQNVTDLDVIFTGSCDDIRSWFGEGFGTMDMACVPVGDGTNRITFSGGYRFPLAAGSVGHFGIRLNNQTSIDIHKMFWTVNGVQYGGNIDFTGLTWGGTINCPVNITVSRVDSTNSSSVTLVDAVWAPSEIFIPLDEMLVDHTSITTLPWQPASGLEGAVLHLPSDSASFTTPQINPEYFSSVLVQYTVVDAEGHEIGTFIEQAEIVPPIPTLTEWGLIILSTLLLGWMAYMLIRRRNKMVVGV